MSTFFRQNRALQKNAEAKKQKEFKLKNGGFVKPTCCSLLINFLQALVTINSLLATKGNVQMYWVPEKARQELEADFKSVQDIEQFWSFIKESIGNAFFFEESMIIPNTTQIDIKKLNSINPKSFSLYSGGMLVMGPIRIL